MKKNLLISILSLILLVSFGDFSFAEENIIESPGIKIFIDNELGTYTDVPIIVNGRTLLPLRAILTNLGVPNDDQHIIWNGKESSVTATKDTIKLYLKVGNKIAKVNDLETTLEVAPINYKNRVYVPARFVAQSFGKKVAWDNYTKRIYIRNEDEFNQVKQILNKAITTTDSVEKINIDKNSKVKTKYAEDDVSDGISSFKIQIDRKNKIKYSVYESKDDQYSFFSETYYINNASYDYDEEANKWEEKPLSEENFLSYLTSLDTVNVINPRDILYAGLSMEEDKENNQIILKGDVYPITGFQENDKHFNNVIDEIVYTYMEIYIDKDTNYITKINSKCNSYFKSFMGGKYFKENNVTYTYRNFNGDFEINIPDEIKKNQTNIDTESIQIILSNEEKATVSTLKESYTKSSIDGMYKNPYNLKVTDAILFIILDDTSFESFISLSDNGKIVFMNECSQENMGDYLGVDIIKTIVVSNSKKYAELDTSYGSVASDLKLKKYDKGEEIDVVIQDKEKNTYKEY